MKKNLDTPLRRKRSRLAARITAIRSSLIGTKGRVRRKLATERDRLTAEWEATLLPCVNELDSIRSHASTGIRYDA